MPFDLCIRVLKDALDIVVWSICVRVLTSWQSTRFAPKNMFWTSSNLRDALDTSKPGVDGEFLPIRGGLDHWHVNAVSSGRLRDINRHTLVVNSLFSSMLLEKLSGVVQTSGKISLGPYSKWDFVSPDIGKT